jgi:DMSO/TMAO reductase YedYZ molybdopterin-dependent catalytic subunit
MKEEYVSETEAKKFSRRSWLSLAAFAGLGAAGYAGWRWLGNQPLDGGIRGGIRQPLRDGLNATDAFFEKTFDPDRLIREYPVSQAVRFPRANGAAGLDPAGFDPAAWSLHVTRANGQVLTIGLDDLKRVPKTKVVFNFKCIEGWSQIQHWGGLRFSEFVQHFGLQKEAARAYVGMSTPDEEYYVGIDRLSALHPQTLLAYEMSGQPLTDLRHGAPLRLIIPVKYGVKHLKRIGTLFFSDERPPDYWAERGYDYYIGH